MTRPCAFSSCLKVTKNSCSDINKSAHLQAEEFERFAWDSIAPIHVVEAPAGHRHQVAGEKIQRVGRQGRKADGPNEVVELNGRFGDDDADVEVEPLLALLVERVFDEGRGLKLHQSLVVVIHLG